MTRILPWIKINYKSYASKITTQEYFTQFSNIVVALPDLAIDDVIHAFIYGLKPRLKGFIKAQA